jgi:hypothetical protein
MAACYGQLNLKHVFSSRVNFAISRPLSSGVRGEPMVPPVSTLKLLVNSGRGDMILY